MDAKAKEYLDTICMACCGNCWLCELSERYKQIDKDEQDRLNKESADDDFFSHQLRLR